MTKLPSDPEYSRTHFVHIQCSSASVHDLEQRFDNFI